MPQVTQGKAAEAKAKNTPAPRSSKGPAQAAKATLPPATGTRKQAGQVADEHHPVPRQPRSSTLPAHIETSPPPPTGRSDGAQVAQQHRPPPRQHATPEEMARFKAGGPEFALAVPKPIPPDPDKDDRSELIPPAQQAMIIQRFFSAEMATAIGIHKAVNVHGFRAYLDMLMLDTATTDPVEIMQLEQLVMTHFQIGRLHRMAGGVHDAKSVEALINAACHLMAEYRRGMIARAKHRQTTGKRPGRKSSKAASTEKKEASGKKSRSHQTGK